ncbi:DUF3302 domain-containing protein [Rhodopirellula europaea]|uniref:DUF3302 domain-containing protein n=2 Tax=Rhodopirellula TaxID=265488 RepID=UPI0030EE6269
MNRDPPTVPGDSNESFFASELKMHDGATYFAWLVLAILFFVAVSVFVWLGSIPKKIAVKRNHPQVDAINACSWLGMALGGIGWPIAFIWALTDFRSNPLETSSTSSNQDSQPTPPSAPTTESQQITVLKQRVEELEEKLQAANNQGDLA